MGDKSPLIKLKGTSNYILWFDYICTEFQKEQVTEYIKEDKIKDIDIDHPTKDQVGLLINNAKARSIILYSITPDIHKKVAGIVSAYQIMNKLKRKYGGDKNDTTYWISRLNALSTSKEDEIMDILDQMKDIFKIMEDSQLKVSKDEQIKYLYKALPEDYMKKFILTENDTFKTLYEKIDADLKKRAYILGWEYNKESDDDRMEIDNVRKSHHHNNKTKTNKIFKTNNKHCEICDLNNHNTKDCWYNIKNKNSKYNKYLENEKINNNKNNDYYKNKNKNNYNYNKNNFNKKGANYLRRISVKILSYL